MVDKSGVLLFLGEFLLVRKMHDGLAIVRTASGWGFLDRKGKFALPPRYSYVGDFSEGLALAYDDEKKKDGYINKQGIFEIPAQFAMASDFSEGMAAVRIGGKWGFIDRKGNSAIEPQFDEVADGHYRSGFKDGLAAVKLKGKLGYIDKGGHLAIPFSFEEARDFSEGLAGVMQDEQWGFIDHQGKWVIKPTFQDVSNFIGGIAKVWEGPTWSNLNWKIRFINRSGESIWEPRQWHSWVY